MPQIEFQDNRIEVKNLIQSAAISFLHEAGGEIAGQAGKNSRRRTGKTAGSFTYKVDEGSIEVAVGSNEENAVWEEFGTGEYAVHGDGRKGYWVFVEGQSSGSKGGKTYDLKGAKRAVAILRQKGLNAYYTKGKKPNKALETAFMTKIPVIKAYAEKAFSNLGGGSSSGSGGSSGTGMKQMVNSSRAAYNKVNSFMNKLG